jgi:hypothetical protein
MSSRFIMQANIHPTFDPLGKGGLIPLVKLMFRKKDGGISVVAKKRSAIGTFF